MFLLADTELFDSTKIKQRFEISSEARQEWLVVAEGSKEQKQELSLT